MTELKLIPSILQYIQEKIQIFLHITVIARNKKTLYTADV